MNGDDSVRAGSNSPSLHDESPDARTMNGFIFRISDTFQATRSQGGFHAPFVKPETRAFAMYITVFYLARPSPYQHRLASVHLNFWHVEIKNPSLDANVAHRLNGVIYSPACRLRTCSGCCARVRHRKESEGVTEQRVFNLLKYAFGRQLQTNLLPGLSVGEIEKALV
jgi:hypothetical protein